MSNQNRRDVLKTMAGALVLGSSSSVQGRSQDASKFDASWDSLKKFRCPDWFRDAKFGIWAHWGPQCVPEQGDWYARNMYIEGQPQYEHHLKTYGHPSKQGYKDIVPLWNAAKFDPERLLDRYQKAGAKYFVALAVHHDNFDCWNSKHHRWNAAQMGPKRDIVGAWRAAALKRNLRFGLTEHLERSYSWFNVNKGHDQKGSYAGVPYDGNNKKFEDFYFPPHEDNNRGYPVNPPAWWQKQWFDRISDLIEQHRPDMLYTDGGIPFGEVGRQLVANYYNANVARHGSLEAIYTIKNVVNGTHGDYQDGAALLDLERGVVDDVRPDPWQTDTCLGNWFYKKGIEYKTPKVVIHMLVDIVSKNGNLLMNFPLKNDGTLDPEPEQVLDELAKWIGVNGEAIYGTRPWKVYGEGPTKMKAGMFGEKDFTGYTANDIRFTTKGKLLYVFCMGGRSGQMTIQSLGSGANRWQGEVASVRLLGGDALQFSRTVDALTIQIPERLPSDHAFALKIA